jgi:ribosome biogenesis GTPase
MAKKKRRIRADFRKNRAERTRQTDWTQQFEQHRFEDEDPVQEERVSGKGELTRRRTVTGSQIEAGDQPGFPVQLEVDETVCRRGRVLAVHGLVSTVRAEDGQTYQCATRRLLKTLHTDQRHVVAVGDRVLFRPVSASELDEGLIERVEPRRGSLCRTSRGRQQIIVTNVDQILIVASAAEPRLKPNLIDRLLVTAEKSNIRPILCINKVDLVDPASLEPLVGVYSQMGYPVLLLSAKTGFGTARLTRLLRDRESVLVGQSGVGKSSLLNAVDGSLPTARLLPLAFGGYVVDTPGIRQFQLWDVISEEVAGLYRDLRPYVSHCRFPDCTHTHEAECAVKDAVADGRLDERRYESYRGLFLGEMD